MALFPAFLTAMTLLFATSHCENKCHSSEYPLLPNVELMHSTVDISNLQLFDLHDGEDKGIFKRETFDVVCNEKKTYKISTINQEFLIPDYIQTLKLSASGDSKSIITRILSLKEYKESLAKPFETTSEKILNILGSFSNVQLLIDEFFNDDYNLGNFKL